MKIRELKNNLNTFGKLIAKVKGYPMITYGYIRYVNDNHIIFEDSAEPSLKYRVHDVESFEVQEFKPKK